MNITESLGWAITLLETGPSPRLDAEVLLRHVCNLSRTELITRSTDTLTDRQWQHFRSLINQRKAGIPIAQLTSEKEFWSLSLKVTANTLIPRPETETLVEQVLAIVPKDVSWDIADLGTGCGAIAVAIAGERPACRITATDFSGTALDVARGNAKTHGLNNIDFALGDWTAALNGKQFDIIVCNPPYIAANDIHLNTGDLVHEPLTALASGKHGLDDLTRIITDGRNCLRKNGHLLLEHGYDQADAVSQLLQQHDYHNIGHQTDLAGHVRITGAQT